MMGSSRLRTLVPLCLCVVVYLLSNHKLQLQATEFLRAHHPAHAAGTKRSREAFEGAPPALARPASESVEAFADRKAYTRRLDIQVLAACESAVDESATWDDAGCGAPAGAAPVSLLQYNVFRMAERGTSELIGSWLATRGYDYVSLNELNGFHNESEFQRWGARHGFARAFLLTAPSNYNIGFLARADTSCVKIAARVNGFAHGVLEVECGPATFFATHLTPFDAASRSHEIASIAKSVWRVLTTKGPTARVAVCGDLNSPPVAAPYLGDLPRELEALGDNNEERAKRLSRKFLHPDASGGLDTVVAATLRAVGLRDACAPENGADAAATDGCAATVPTAVAADDSHSLVTRLDYVWLGGAWRNCDCADGLGCGSTVRAPITDVLSDHYPLEVRVRALATNDVEPRAPLPADLPEPWSTLSPRGKPGGRRPPQPKRQPRSPARRLLAAGPRAPPSMRSSDALSTAERDLACGWARAFQIKYAAARERAAAVLREFAETWKAEEAAVDAGPPGPEDRGTWRPVRGEPGVNCHDTCARAGPFFPPASLLPFLEDHPLCSRESHGRGRRDFRFLRDGAPRGPNARDLRAAHGGVRLPFRLRRPQGAGAPGVRGRPGRGRGGAVPDARAQEAAAPPRLPEPPRKEEVEDGEEAGAHPQSENREMAEAHAR